MISFTGSRLRMISGGAEIGDWEESMYTLTPTGEGSFRLHVEDDELTFKPDSPAEFASAASQVEATRAAASGPPSRPGMAYVVKEGPPAGLLTMLLFYLLVAATIVMGVWAAFSLAGP